MDRSTTGMISMMIGMWYLGRKKEMDIYLFNFFQYHCICNLFSIEPFDNRDEEIL